MTAQKNTTKNPLFYLYRMMWRYSEGNQRTVVLFSIMSIVAGTVWALEPLAVGFLLNSIQTGGVTASNIPLLASLLAGFFLIDVIGWAFHGLARIMENKNAFIVRSNYKKALLQGTMGLPIEWHTDHHSGDTIDKIDKGTTALFNFSETTHQTLQAIVTLVSGISVMFYYDAYATAVVLFFTIPTFFVLAAFDKRLVPGYRRVSSMENELSAKVFDTLSNVTTVIILRVETLVFKAIEVSIGKSYAQYMTNIYVNEWKWFTASVLGRLASVGVIAIYLFRAASMGTVMVGTIFILYGYVDRIRGIFFQFAYLYNDIIKYRARVANAEELSKDFREPLNAKKMTLPKNWSLLDIKGLSFSYGDSDVLHINDVSMTLKKGERIAVIGESGGGKSTFLKLLRDLYHPKSLNLEVDGVIVDGGFAGISNSISLVPQDPEIFATTIRENITLGIEYSESHLKVFTDMAAFTDVVGRLPKGLESSVVEKGVNLSGGEKQRLALARGLIASEHKDIVLLDEPTSSVDFANELKIYENIFESFPGKTIISSIHRLHLLSLFDAVYLFNGGRIIAKGTFDELKEHSPEFKSLWEKYLEARDRENT